MWQLYASIAAGFKTPVKWTVTSKDGHTNATAMVGKAWLVIEEHGTPSPGVFTHPASKEDQRVFLAFLNGRGVGEFGTLEEAQAGVEAELEKRLRDDNGLLAAAVTADPLIDLHPAAVSHANEVGENDDPQDHLMRQPISQPAKNRATPENDVVDQVLPILEQETGTIHQDNIIQSRHTFVKMR